MGGQPSQEMKSSEPSEEQQQETQNKSGLSFSNPQFSSGGCAGPESLKKRNSNKKSGFLDLVEAQMVSPLSFVFLKAFFSVFSEVLLLRLASSILLRSLKELL